MCLRSTREREDKREISLFPIHSGTKRERERPVCDATLTRTFLGRWRRRSTLLGSLAHCKSVLLVEMVLRIRKERDGDLDGHQEANDTKDDGVRRVSELVRDCLLGVKVKHDGEDTPHHGHELRVVT